MTLSQWHVILPFIAAILTAGLACWIFSGRQTVGSYRSLAILLAAISITHLANGFGLLDDARWLLSRRLLLASELVQPVALFYAGIHFQDQSVRAGHAFRLWTARIMGIAGLLLVLFTMTDHVLLWRVLEKGEWVVEFGPWGFVPHVFIILAMALGLAQLEAVLRASSEPVRYRLKLIAIGLGGMAGYEIYQASQILLLGRWQPENTLVSSVVTMISLSLLVVGMARNRFQNLLVHAYVSPQALFGSLAFIVIGLYLLAVGAIGEWLRRTNQPFAAEFSVIIVFAAVLVLVVAALSKTVRGEVRRFLARNFYQSKYDYRAEWLRVTEAFQSAASRDAILDRLLDLLIKTFSTTTIAVWTFREADRRFVQVRPVVTSEDALELSHPIVAQLFRSDEPVIFKKYLLTLKTMSQSKFVLYSPINIQGRLAAFIALGEQSHGETYGTDDCDLLRGICRHVGALLAQASLAEERRASAEIEALHRFSVFCLHDLKNLAARLSLIAQNAEQHGRDPAFQESVMRTVADTAKKMTTLMSKLSRKDLHPTIAGESELVDIPSLLEEIVAPLREDGLVKLTVTSDSVPPVKAVREQLYQALLNVILNARYAIKESGTISIAVQRSDRSVLIRIEDTGEGIPPSRFDTLFQPAQSNRPGGLGVGLYQCRKIVESYGGYIQIRSEVGKGTQVQIEWPLSNDNAPCAVPARAAVSS